MTLKRVLCSHMTAEREKLNTQNTLGAFWRVAGPEFHKVQVMTSGTVTRRIVEGDGSGDVVEVARHTRRFTFPGPVGSYSAEGIEFPDAEQEQARMLARVNGPEVAKAFFFVWLGANRLPARKFKRNRKQRRADKKRLFSALSIRSVKQLREDVEIRKRCLGSLRELIGNKPENESVSGYLKLYKDDSLTSSIEISVLKTAVLRELLKLLNYVLHGSYRVHLSKVHKLARRVRSRVPRPPDLLPCPPSAPLAPPA